MAKRIKKSNKQNQLKKLVKQIDKLELQTADLKHELKTLIIKAIENGLTYDEFLNHCNQSNIDISNFDLSLIEEVYNKTYADMYSQSSQSYKRSYIGKKREKPEEQSVETYLEALAYALQVSRIETNKYKKAHALRMYTDLREARVFHIEQPTYIAIHQEADRFTTTEIAGLDFHYEDRKLSPGENDKYINALINSAKRQQFPNKLPFPVTFFGYATGVRLPEHIKEFKAPAAIRSKINKLYLVGHYVSTNEVVVAFYRGLFNDGQNFIWGEILRDDTGWIRSIDLEPWIIPHLVKLINDHRTFIIETQLPKYIKKDIKHNRKELGIDDYAHMPKPYYTLHLQSKVIREQIRKSFIVRGAALYRTDVRAHERCKIRRGKLPINPETAAKLNKYGYKIFTTNELDAETYKRLSERTLTYKRSDEWLAVKIIWVREHYTSNNEQLPYIPAIRKLTNTRINREEIKLCHK